MCLFFHPGALLWCRVFDFLTPPPPSVTLALALLIHERAAFFLRCAADLTARQLLQLHARLVVSPPPLAVDPNVVAVKLISASAAHTNPRHAALVFSAIPSPNLVAWNAFLRALTLHHFHHLALRYFRRLLDAGFPIPDEYTFTSILKSVTVLLLSGDGHASHAFCLKRGFHDNLFVQNSLVDMYFKFGVPEDARRVFDEMLIRDVVSWNTLIAGLSVSGDVDSARQLFDHMPERTFVSWSTMISGYARSGNLASARELFEQMTERNVVCWNAMIAGYSQNEKFSESITLFRRMLQSDTLQPNNATLVSVLSACAHLGALDLGRWIERFIERRSIHLSLFLGNALSDMYAKCGCINEAKRIFKMMQERDVISWSIIITGSAMHGHAEEAISHFHEMLSHNVEPNDITFMGVLSACTHAGLVDVGRDYFHMMTETFKIIPKVEHYGCIVDLLSRAGRLGEAENLVNSMQVEPNAIVWGALLGGCRIHKDIIRGERIVQRMMELDPKHAGSYVYLATAYGSMGRLEDAAKFRLMMRERKVEKIPGCSWIEIDNMVHEFFVGDRSHPQSEKIYSMISKLVPKMKLAGYVPNTSIVCQSINEEEKEVALSLHSEKLAVAFGLISTPDGTTIRIVKNLRVCNDCHEAMKIISKIVRREIIMRDRSRFHHFKEGHCSCRDYW